MVKRNGRAKFLICKIMKKLSKQYYFELAVFCMDYHGGQSSKGYRILSRLNAQLSDNCIAECRDSEAYNWLVTNYGEKV